MKTPRATLLLSFLCIVFILPVCVADKTITSISNKKIQFYLSDELLGYRPKENSTVRARYTTDDGTLVYDAVYSIDSFARRLTPVENPERRTISILCFGCSLMYGEGVNDNETFPYNLAKLMPQYMPYNYAFVGYGPQEMLAKLQSGQIVHEVKGGHAIALYLFIDCHVDRAIGSLQTTGNWGYKMPYYCIDKNNALVRKGSFASGRRLLTSLYLAVMENRTLRWLIGMREFPVIRDSHISLTERIIEESRNEFKKQFNSDDFYVILFDGHSTRANKMEKVLKERGVKYILFEPEIRNNDYYYCDGHPTALTYKRMAKFVAGCLNKNLTITPEPNRLHTSVTSARLQ